MNQPGLGIEQDIDIIDKAKNQAGRLRVQGMLGFIGNNRAGLAGKRLFQCRPGIVRLTGDFKRFDKMRLIRGLA